MHAQFMHAWLNKSFAAMCAMVYDEQVFGGNVRHGLW